ncbi:LPS-assembly protein LptD [Neorhizobium sp. CSC1952]|mgnify:CR=1 FL=1|uniref:LPS-assembly protein LptD n=1 Tax=Xaviernesmea oryzae TaxID=464029 RepID=A0A1X7FEC2_9HYPH|nr:MULTISPECIES: LPS-assembly protein LptD [Rhizobium/Agrobacterium group]WJR67468.1 LPS-assembly protein LptD [Rhizobium sp. CSC1952]SMF50526.1 LPS-assembly protein [Xaviernesmea oryzae]
MAVSDRKNIRRLAAALLTGVSVCVLGVSATTVHAQSLVPAPAAGDDAKLLLRANELVYNQDAQQVTATGGVQMYYNRYRMVAQRVQYDQRTGRVMATGNIELIEPGGTRVYADELDITDDFGEGFLNALRVETTDNTRLAAESAERQQGDLMVLNNTVYTACLPCTRTPGKAPLWQVKAERVIRNGQTHTIRLENAQFELFGLPIGRLPFAIEVPDETVERKSGLLFPRFSASDNLGFGVTVPYYHVFSPSMDATISPTYYSTQGLLIEGEVRNRFDNGEHTFRFAGIHQQDTGVFNSGTSDRESENRFMVASKGEFQINPRWTFGWNVMAQTDNNFSRTYNLEGVDNEIFTNDVYLTGLGTRNYFDLHGYYFNVQDDADENTRERQQAVVYPSLDYSYYAPEPILGGEFSVTANFTNLSRREDDWYHEGTTDRFPGLEGSYSRFTAEAEWKRTFNTFDGLLLTPILAARGDGIRTTSSGTPGVYLGDLEEGGSGRYMVTAGLEARYPVLLTTENSSHIIEPIAQIFVRPDEQMAGSLPNEDAQSFVFDATTLFERDKFSGFDRVEGGTRANVGLRYTGSFANGIGVRGIFGQSYQIAGRNSFATEDLVQAGANSGLETRVSDYVAMAAIDLPQGFTIAANTRFDEKTLAVKRTDLSFGYTTPRLSGTLVYTQVDPQPQYGSEDATDVLKHSMSFRINENWSLAGTATWDLTENDVIRRGIGISYADECTIFTLAYTDKPSDTAANDWTVSARLSFRTLGDINIGSTTDYDQDYRY